MDENIIYVALALGGLALFLLDKLKKELTQSLQSMATRVDNIEKNQPNAYDDTALKDSMSLDKTVMQNLSQRMNILAHNMNVLKGNFEAKPIIKPIVNERRLPPPRPKLVIDPELKNEILERYGTGNYSIRKLATAMGIKKHIVERCIEGIDQKKMRETKESYIG
jgi:hypothetical protein